MATPYFQFQQFTVHQDRCAMKVGTDGVLLGAWANGGRKILDVGTGTGLIALMMAQRFTGSLVEAIDIDAAACKQAAENFMASPFNQRLKVSNVSLQSFTISRNSSDIVVNNHPSQLSTLGTNEEINDESVFFDSIVCNPPFFVNALKTPNAKRSIARHTEMLSHEELMTCVAQLLTSDGEFSAIIPFDVRAHFDSCAAIAGLFPSRVCGFKTSERKSVKRFLLTYKKEPVRIKQDTQMLMNSDEYHTLLRDFYLHF